MESLTDKLRREFDSGTVVTGGDIGARYCSDWSKSPSHHPSVLLRPTTTEQVARMLSLCHASGQPVVTQGGMTGLAGAATPEEGEMALSLERMSGIEELDEDSMTMTVLAGTPLETAQKAAQDAGLYLPLDLGARGSCSIGGNVATNAGGNQVIRYGMTRNLVLGLEAVLADGRIIRSMSKVIKNNSGYDLKQLFIGSEGTLGVVTRVILRLQPHLPRTHNALCALADFKKAVGFFKYVQGNLPGGASAFELMWANYYDYIIQEVEHLRNPFTQQHAVYVLLQYQSADKTMLTDLFEQLLFDALQQDLLVDVLVAQSEREAELFWQIRDGIGDVIPQLGPVAFFDISVPINVMATFVSETEQEIEEACPGAQLLLFGHIGDGNLHLAVRLEDAAQEQPVYDMVHRKVGLYAGAISAEHGIGKTRKKYLQLSRTEEEIALMKQLKAALDPQQILNRGRIF